MTSSKITDLGAGGTITAEKFAVEVQLTNGETRRQTAYYDSYDAADAACAQIEGRIESGEYDDAFTAYVVTADGTEV